MPFLSFRGALKDPRRIAIWVHWEPTGAVSEADLFLLRHLRELGNSIIAIGNRDGDATADFDAALADVADVVVQRPNHGYDFGAYRDILLHLRPQLSQLDRILLLNNSFYGPFGTLAPALTAADPGLADVWGLTGSTEIQRHIQSYFLIFHKRALSSDSFCKFWLDLQPPHERTDVVLQCEIPLMRAMLAQGLRVRSVVPYEELAATAAAMLGLVAPYAHGYAHIAEKLSILHPLNPTHQLWRWLLLCGVPIIKKELLRHNPLNLPDPRDWRSLVPDCELARLVETDLGAFAALSAELRQRPPFEPGRAANHVRRHRSRED